MIPFRILHVFRTPVGGLFRHVLDVARGQSRLGHEVGIFCDSGTGGERAEAALAALAPELALGVTRIPMRRNPHPADLGAISRLQRICTKLKPDVLHGHGSKGGLFARLAPSRGAIRAYTPHGGSFNYEPGTLLHHLYMGAERLLAKRTDVFLLESQSVRQRFESHVGHTDKPVRVVHNGISREELERIVSVEDPFDLLYIGELRALKGIDTLIDAVGRIRRERQVALRLLIVGAGPDEAVLHDRVKATGLSEATVFRPPMPIREALRQGRIMVVPSRAESLPYVVLEAAAAAQPLVSTDVGGIPEIFGPFSRELIPADDVDAMALAILRKLGESEADRRSKAEALRRHVGENFSIEGMVEGILAGYGAAATSGRLTTLALKVP